MIVLPSNYFFIAHTTLRCNYKCSYCIQEFDQPRENGMFKFKELDTHIWIKNLINFKAPYLVISGGEVTLRNDSATIACAVADNFGHVEIGTNLSKDPTLIIKEIEQSGKKNVYIGTSFHPERTNEKMFMYYINKILKSSIRLHNVAIVDTFDGKGRKAYKEFMKRGVPNVSLNPFQGRCNLNGIIYPKEMANSYSNMKPHPSVLCKTTMIAISPNGNIYPCSHLLYINHGISNLGNIQDEDYENKINTHIEIGTVCNQLGFCNPCNVHRIFPKEIEK